VKLATLGVLSDREVLAIHQASLDILMRAGVRIRNVEMLHLLAARGLSIDEGTQIVRIPRSAVEDALAAAPATFPVHNREGALLYELGHGGPRIAAGHNAVFWVDSDTGETRRSTVADVEAFARICEQLEAIDMVGIPVMPQDVRDPSATLLHAVRAVVRNSRKPVFFSTDRAEVNGAAMEMLASVYPGDIGREPYGIGQLSPTSPLSWEEGVIDALVDTVRTGVPLAILPEPNAGISAPYTLAGLLTVNNAEWLSGLVIAQLTRPGAAVMYANSWTTTDMRTGAACVGSTETTICRIAGAQFARFYRVPSHTTAPNSDNHAHDEQNAWEKALSLFCAAAAGNDLIVNCGMFATGLTCSHEQLVMDEEMAAMSLRIAEGIAVSEDTMAVELIVDQGPNGDGYLTSDHTLRWLRSAEHIIPRVSVRGAPAAWVAAGAKDTYALARQRARELAARPGPSLDADRAARMDEILGAFEGRR
jgi:trimethylamine--corrinoid protein Co-methyltransferase